MEEYKQLLEASKRFTQIGKLDDAASALELASDQVNKTDCPERKYIISQALALRKKARSFINPKRTADDMAKILEIVKRTYRVTSADSLDDYLIYFEWDRAQKDRFYMPRRFALLPIVEQIERLAKGEIDVLGVSLPPGTGKSTLAMFALTWMAGRRPDKGMLIGSHSASILQGMYDELLRLLKDEEYNFESAFNLKVASTNALNMQINIGKAKRFANFQFASKDSNLAGKVRAQSLLYLDDLVGSMDEAMNAAAMEKLWQQLTADYFQRREDKCPTLIIGTRWSVNDPIGRLESINARNERAVFLKIPALNDNGESNFDYGEEHSGYTTAGYLKMKEDMDDLAWKSLYMQEPVEREGQLYNRDMLKRFFELPDGEPDAVLSVCDTSNGKGDFNSMPIAYVYGEEHYIADVCFTDAFPEIADRQLANKLIKHDVQRCQFESNNAGERIADKIQEMIKSECRTKITKKHTQENKETKIVVNSDWVKEHCLFLDDSIIEKGSDYDKFMRQLTSYSTRGRNQHDDAADSMAQYALFIHGSIRPKAVLVNRRQFGI